MSQDQIIIIMSTFFWFYIDTFKIFKNDKILNSCIINSGLTAVYTNFACFMYPQLIYNFPQIEPYLPSWIRTVLLITYGYGYRDLYFGIENRKLDEIAHATIYLVGCGLAYSTDNMSLLIVPFTLETSSFFLNLRSLQNIICDASFVLTFVFYRFVILPIFCYYYLMNEDTLYKTHMFVVGGSITLLNMYWFILISKKAIKMYNKNTYNNLID